MRDSFKTIIGFLFVFVLVASVRICSANEKFPLYECIRPNVEFWKKVYAEYPSTKGLIHDSDNLDIIYEVIDLMDEQRPGARKINKRRVKKVKAKYQTILAHLGAGRKPRTAEEKKVFALFGKGASPKEFQQARRNIRYQKCQQDRFRDGLIRSGAYLEEMKKIFRSYGLPVDLAYLPHVESSFNYEAYSKFGAAGVWQFTRSTGKRFMQIDYTIDERRDPIRATHAAARYLKENYKILGDWPLAITSYNHGEAGMKRAQKKHGCYEEIFKNYRQGYFKFASRNFYSEFLAAREVARNFKKYFGEIDLMPPALTTEIPLDAYVSAIDIADYFDLDMETLKSLNPALRNPVFNGQKFIPKGYRLRLPNKQEIARLAIDIPADLFRAEQKRSRFYRVQRGDTAGLIARRHRVKLHDLIMANQLDRRATVYVGQNLRIPQPGENMSAVTVAAVHKKTVVSPSQKTGTLALAKTSDGIYKVRKGDTASKVAQMFGVTLENLLTTNNIKSKRAVILAGQNLVIPDAGMRETAVIAESDAPASHRKAMNDIENMPQVASSRSYGDRQTTESQERDKGAGKTSSSEKEETRLALLETPSSVVDVMVQPVPGLNNHLEQSGKMSPGDLQQVETLSLTLADVGDSIAQEAATENFLAISKPDLTMENEVNPAVVTGNLEVEKILGKGKTRYGVITVEAGETLGHYAEWLEIPTREIRHLNRYRFGRPIKTGQSLKIPLKKVDKETFEERRYEYHKEIEEDFFAAFKVEGVNQYEIKSGDNIWTLCREVLDMPFWLIRKYNTSLDFNELRPAQIIKVPVVESVSG